MPGMNANKVIAIAHFFPKTAHMEMNPKRAATSPIGKNQDRKFSPKTRRRNDFLAGFNLFYH